MMDSTKKKDTATNRPETPKTKSKKPFQEAAKMGEILQEHSYISNDPCQEIPPVSPNTIEGKNTASATNRAKNKETPKHLKNEYAIKSEVAHNTDAKNPVSNTSDERISQLVAKLITSGLPIKCEKVKSEDRKEVEVTGQTENDEVRNGKGYDKILGNQPETNPHNVDERDDKNKIQKSVISKDYDGTAIETKMNNGEQNIAQDVKPNTFSDSKEFQVYNGKNNAEKSNDLAHWKRLRARKECNVNEVKCLVCDIYFKSLKKLYYHMLLLHFKKREFYKCPSCKAQFVQISGVNQHLKVTHNKSKKQISKLRAVIKKNCLWKKSADVWSSMCKYMTPTPIKKERVERKPTSRGNKNV